MRRSSHTLLQPCLLFPRKAESPQRAEETGLVTSDPLAWWKEHQQEYPRLSTLARRYLCITPTSVPCERVFSKGGWIVNKRRCSLSDDHISSLLFVSFNSHHRDKKTVRNLAQINLFFSMPFFCAWPGFCVLSLREYHQLRIKRLTLLTG